MKAGEAMQLALAEARRAAERGEVPVGAVVLAPDGSLLASAGNGPIGACDPTAHAEIEALRAAARALGNYRLTGCTLVVTVEPCLMCLGAMVHARIGHLCFGTREPKWGGIEAFRALCQNQPFNHDFPWEEGLEADAAAALLKGFFRERRQGGSRA